MGIIYETIRKVENTEEDALTLFCKDAESYISFTNFMELLEIYSDDTTDLIAKYLMDDNQFLKLDFYMFDDALLTDTPQRDVFYRYRYNCYEHSSHITYPTEHFLKDAIGGGRLSDYSWHYWKIEDLLAIESIVYIGLDEVKFKVIESAIESSSPTVLSCFNENEELKQQLEVLQNNLAKNEGMTLATKLEGAQDKIANLQNQLVQAKAELANTSVDDEPTHHKTINSMATLVATLLKLASYDKQDLENPHGNINKEIIAKAEGLGLTLGKDFIAKWLKKADEVL